MELKDLMEIISAHSKPNKPQKIVQEVKLRKKDNFLKSLFSKDQDPFQLISIPNTTPVYDNNNKDK